MPNPTPNPLTLLLCVHENVQVRSWDLEGIGMEQWSGVKLWRCGTRRKARFAFVYTYTQRLHPLPLRRSKKLTKTMPNWVEFLALATHSNSIRDRRENAFSVGLTWQSNPPQSTTPFYLLHSHKTNNAH